VRDIKNYVTKVRHFDKNFITVCFYFCKEIMPYVDHELIQGLIMRTVENFENLTIAQLSYSSLNSFLLHDKDPKSRVVRTELISTLENYLEKNHQTLVETI
jgi:hypothetical protein